MGFYKASGCLFFLEEGFKAAYVYTFVDVYALYSDDAICKHIYDCLGSSIGSIHIFNNASNFYEELVPNGVIINYYFLIFLVDCLDLLVFVS